MRMQALYGNYADHFRSPSSSAGLPLDQLLFSVRVFLFSVMLDASYLISIEQL